MRVSTRKRREMAGTGSPQPATYALCLGSRALLSARRGSLLDAIPSYCLEMKIWGWVENDNISPKTQKRKSTRNGYPDQCKKHQDHKLSMNLINFFIFFKTPPKVKKEDPVKIPFKSLEARMKQDSRLKQKQDATTRRYAINKTNRRNSHVARVPPSSSVKRAVRYIFGASILTNLITVYLYVKKDRSQRRKHNLHVVTHISSQCFLEVGVRFFGVFFYIIIIRRRRPAKRSQRAARKGEMAVIQIH